MSAERLTVDGLAVELRRSPRRKSMELIVDRAGEVIVAAPQAASRAAVEAAVRSGREWLHGKLARKQTLRSAMPHKEYVSGEGFLYLGRSYRLLLVDGQRSPLGLRGGRFRLLRAEQANGRAHFVRWYTEHGRSWLPPRVAGLAARLRRQPAGVQVRDLGSRWASCGRTGVLHFHWATLTLPPALVDYLALHELLHLEIPDHGARFWRRLENLLPDYESRRELLAQQGGAGVL